ncbi:MAG: hypothetical protein PHO56_05120 [Patescibacteria group bacterium]|nr:hypothetical protein [Patescibacteria group bacterium]
MFKKKFLILTLLAVVFILLLGIGGTSYLLWQKSRISVVQTDNQSASEQLFTNREVNPIAPDNAIDTTPDASAPETATATPQLLTAAEKQIVFDNVYSAAGLNVAVPPGKTRIKIDWTKETGAKAADIFSSQFKNISNLSVGNFQKLLDYRIDEYEEYGWSVAVAGIVSSSSQKYAGDYVYNLAWSCFSMGCNYYFSGYAVADPGTAMLYLLSRYSLPQSDLEKGLGFKVFTEDNTAFISELENPGAIAIPGSNYFLRKSSSDYANHQSPLTDMLRPFSENGQNTYLFDAPNGKKVYLGYAGCFEIFNENGGNSAYYFDNPVVDMKSAARSGSVIDVTFSDGKKNTRDYLAADIGGCGSLGCGSFVEASSSELRVIGKFRNGDPAYEYAASSSDALPEPLSGQYGNSYVYGGDRPSVGDFLAGHPIILWKTPIKDYYWSFKDASYVPAVECAKPVIYLYPPKTTDVSVQVSPNGGFSSTSPAYGNGWRVLSDPQSNLFNYADGKNYPYLFWEGKALYYQRPAQGFVVARSELDGFLSGILAKLGLLSKEITDFKDFWEPKMKAKPYYFVTFLPQAEFDKLAPLAISPHPDTVIRVFMDYQGLDQPISVVAPRIITPQRKGFTVVEWGGAKGRE